MHLVKDGHLKGAKKEVHGVNRSLIGMCHAFYLYGTLWRRFEYAYLAYNGPAAASQKQIRVSSFPDKSGSTDLERMKGSGSLGRTKNLELRTRDSQRP